MKHSIKKKAPFAAKESKTTLHKNLEFTASEQYRLLRTNIMFTLPENVKCPIIGVTSSMRGEGKSTTSVNLSYFLAEKEQRVLLIDGDLRIPSIARKAEIKSSPGLTDMLIGKHTDTESLKSSIHERLYILPSGDIPPNPSELLGSERMKRLLDAFTADFDYIVIDLPPVNLVSDAVSISSLLTGMIVVIREDYATKQDLEACFRQMKLSGVNILGCVMNQSNMGAGIYRKYTRSKEYKYYRYTGYDTSSEVSGSD